MDEYKTTENGGEAMLSDNEETVLITKRPSSYESRTRIPSGLLV